MSRRPTAMDGLSLGVLALAGAVTAVEYPLLPDVIPTHFDARGVANGFMHKDVGAWIALAVACVAFVLVRALTLFFAGEDGKRLEDSPVDVVMFLVNVLLAEVQVMLLYVWLNGTQLLAGALGASFGAFFVALSFVLPRVRRNRLVGVRTPWTLASDENWARTHRFASYACLAGGLPATLLGLAGYGLVAWIPLALASLAPVVYSFRIARS